MKSPRSTAASACSNFTRTSTKAETKRNSKDEVRALLDRLPDDVRVEDIQYHPSAGAVVMGSSSDANIREQIYYAASRPSSVTIACPISVVPTRRMFGCMMSPVR
jgi:hypothetical protein